KAKEIAAAIFGRVNDFDPQNDSIVRVHTARLRARRAEYYIPEGADDDLIMTVPRGSYVLLFHPRAAPRRSPPMPRSMSSHTPCAPRPHPPPRAGIASL